MSRHLRLTTLLLTLLAQPAFAAGDPVGTWRLSDAARADAIEQFKAALDEHYGADERAAADAKLEAQQAETKKLQPEVADQFDAIFAKVREILLDPLPIFEQTVAATFPKGGEMRLSENGEAVWTGYDEDVENATDGAASGSWEADGEEVSLLPDVDVGDVSATDLRGRVEDDVMRLHAVMDAGDDDTTPEGLRQAFEQVEWTLERE